MFIPGHWSISEICNSWFNSLRLWVSTFCKSDISKTTLRKVSRMNLFVENTRTCFQVMDNWSTLRVKAATVISDKQCGAQQARVFSLLDEIEAEAVGHFWEESLVMVLWSEIIESRQECTWLRCSAHCWGERRVAPSCIDPARSSAGRARRRAGRTTRLSCSRAVYARSHRAQPEVQKDFYTRRRLGSVVSLACRNLLSGSMRIPRRAEGPLRSPLMGLLPHKADFLITMQSYSAWTNGKFASAVAPSWKRWNTNRAVETKPHDWACLCT